MDKQFRQNKYLNESGSKTGSWYMNRFEFFKFHQYPEYKKHKYISIVSAIGFLYATIKAMSVSLLLAFILFFFFYLSIRTFEILRTRVCRYDGYFLYPKKIVQFFRDREVEVDVDDFDSVATMHDIKK